MRSSIVFAAVFFIVASCASAEEQPDSFSKCFDKDSIACVQMTVFRHAKSFFEKPTIDLFGGLSLAKTAEAVGRQGKSLDDNSLAVETAKSVEGRNSELETYFFTNAKNFFQERSLSFNFVDAARSLSNAIPDDIKTDIKDIVSEGRLLKKKKLLKKILPLLAGLKVKLVALAIAALLGLLFLAKKALVTSFLALGLALAASVGSLGGAAGGSGGSGGGILSRLTGLFSGGGGSSSGIGGYSAGGGWPSASYSSSSYGGGGGGGWSSGAGNSGWDSHGAYSSPVAQSVAYAGQKPSSV